MVKKDKVKRMILGSLKVDELGTCLLVIRKVQHWDVSKVKKRKGNLKIIGF